jgi:hypothetical protein
MSALIDEVIKINAFKTEENSEEIDENDPLWKATLKLTSGDRAKALKLLEDPDALMQYPEIRMVMEAADASEEADWETTADAVPPTAAAPMSEPILHSKASTAATPAVTSPSKAASTTIVDALVDDSLPEEEAVVLEEGDPRQHLNLVFIGHVDAGKSTLSGSLLYLMGKVLWHSIVVMFLGCVGLRVQFGREKNMAISSLFDCLQRQFRTWCMIKFLVTCA